MREINSFNAIIKSYGLIFFDLKYTNWYIIKRMEE